jgi:hypothetical protein
MLELVADEEDQTSALGFRDRTVSYCMASDRKLQETRQSRYPKLNLNQHQCNGCGEWRRYRLRRI